MHSSDSQPPLDEAQTETLISGIKKRRENRRELIRNAVGLGAMGLLGASMFTKGAEAQRGSLDPAVLNFALNLEYLEAEYYIQAYFGTSITAQGAGTDGISNNGNAVNGVNNVTIKANPQVTFDTALIGAYAREIAIDELNHVNFLRTALASGRVARPNLDLLNSFNTLAQSTSPALGASFDPFANENNFLVGAFIFEDVGVTAYKGAARLIANKDFLEAAAGILAVEAYHAGEVRTVLASRGTAIPAGFTIDVNTIIQRVSDLRDVLDGAGDKDQGILEGGFVNILPTDADSIAFSRTTTQVLNIVYGNTTTTPGLFFPNGLNGLIR